MIRKTAVGIRACENPPGTLARESSHAHSPDLLITHGGGCFATQVQVPDTEGGKGAELFVISALPLTQRTEHKKQAVRKEILKAVALKQASSIRRLVRGHRRGFCWKDGSRVFASTSSSFPQAPPTSAAAMRDRGEARRDTCASENQDFRCVKGTRISLAFHACQNTRF